MSALKKKLEKLNSRLAALSVRERVLGTVVMFAALFFLGEVLLFAPLDRKKQDLHMESENVFSQIMQYQADFNSLVSDSLQDPTLAARRKLERLRLQAQEMDRQQQGVEKGFTVQQEPTFILQEFLRADSGLQVIEVKKGEAVPFKFPGSESGAENSNLVSQSFEIELEGRYMTFLDYIEAIEQSALKLFWDGLELKVVNYPMNRITLKIHTLSLAKE